MSDPVDPRLRHGIVRTMPVAQQEESKTKPAAAENEAKTTEIGTAEPSDVESNGFVTTPEMSRSNSIDWIRGSG